MNSKNLKILFWVLMFFIALFQVQAADFNYEINNTNLPLTKTEYVLVTVPNNTMNNESNLLNILYGQFLAGISQINMTTTQTNITINVNVPITTTISNYTTFINMSFYSNITNTTYFANFSFNIKIYNETQLITPFFFIDLNKYGYEICDYSIEKDPYKTTFTTSMSSTANSNIRVLCPTTSFATCPGVIFTTTITVPILLNITIPINKTPGMYEDNIRFYQDSLVITNTTNYTITNPIEDNITLQYTIKDCPKPLTSISSCAQIVCNSTNIDEFLTCTARVAQCYNDVYNALLDANKTRDINTTIIINNTIEKPVLSYDPNISSVLKSYYDLTLANNRLLIDSSGKQDRIKELEVDKDRLLADNLNMKDSIPLLVRQSLLDLMLQNQNLSVRIQEQEETTISNITAFVVFSVISLIGLGFAGYKWYDKTHIY